MNTIANNIKKYREQANLSPQTLAERIVVTRKAVSSWEHNKSHPDLETLMLIAVALNVDVIDLIYDNRRSSEEFVRSKPKRVRRAIILTVVFLSVLMSVIFLYRAIPVNEQAQISKRILHTTLTPFAYASGTAALASVLTIWYDFGVSRKSVRILLFCLGSAYVLFYFVVLYGSDSESKLSEWLYDYPILFVLSGALLFWGCNKKPGT